MRQTKLVSHLLADKIKEETPKTPRKSNRGKRTKKRVVGIRKRKSQTAQKPRKSARKTKRPQRLAGINANHISLTNQVSSNSLRKSRRRKRAPSKLKSIPEDCSRVDLHIDNPALTPTHLSAVKPNAKFDANLDDSVRFEHELIEDSSTRAFSFNDQD